MKLFTKNFKFWTLSFQTALGRLASKITKGMIGPATSGSVVPLKRGIQSPQNLNHLFGKVFRLRGSWIPAVAGTTAGILMFFFVPVAHAATLSFDTEDHTVGTSSPFVVGLNITATDTVNAV